jgi:hypothetical protein
MNKSTYILLPTDKQTEYERVMAKCKAIEEILQIEVNPNSGDELNFELSKRLSLLGYASSMLAEATSVYDWAKGETANIIMRDNTFPQLKQEVLKLFIQGRLSTYSALYVRAENVIKDLRSSIEGIRTMLSYEKELIRNKVIQN